MNKQKYKQIQAGVATFTAVIMAVSIALRRYELAMIGVVLGILVVYTASKQLDEVLIDERNAHIQQKASTMTLSILTVGLAFVGLVLVEFSYRGYESLKGYGYFMAYLAMGIMTLNSIFIWYYGRQMGD